MPNAILAVFVIAGAVGVYFFPTIVASSRRTANAGGVFVINLFAGWSFVGWIVALVMAWSGAVGPEGRRAMCANCRAVISVNDSDCPHCGAHFTNVLASQTERKCPYCAEMIKVEAVLCRFCHSEVEPLRA